MNTLFEKLGGEDAVNATVDIFYRKVLTDDSISHFFETVDMEGIISGHAPDIALSEHPDLKGWKVFLYGAPEMVKKTSNTISNNN